jgi:hypothetical protein
MMILALGALGSSSFSDNVKIITTISCSQRNLAEQTHFHAAGFNEPLARLPGDGMPTSIEDLRAALLDARQHQVDAAARLVARHLALCSRSRRLFQPELFTLVI